jgi:hypothetical protein
MTHSFSRNDLSPHAFAASSIHLQRLQRGLDAGDFVGAQEVGAAQRGQPGKERFGSVESRSPTGFHPSAQGWSHCGLPWEPVRKTTQPQRGCVSPVNPGCNPFRVGQVRLPSPSVARPLPDNAGLKGAILLG